LGYIVYIWDERAHKPTVLLWQFLLPSQAPVKIFPGQTPEPELVTAVRRIFPQNKFSTYTKTCELPFHKSVPRGTFIFAKPRPFCIPALIHKCEHRSVWSYAHRGGLPGRKKAPSVAGKGSLYAFL